MICLLIRYKFVYISYLSFIYNTYNQSLSDRASSFSHFFVLLFPGCKSQLQMKCQITTTLLSFRLSQVRDSSFDISIYFCLNRKGKQLGYHFLQIIIYLFIGLELKQLSENIFLCFLICLLQQNHQHSTQIYMAKITHNRYTGEQCLDCDLNFFQVNILHLHALQKIIDSPTLHCPFIDKPYTANRQIVNLLVFLL